MAGLSFVTLLAYDYRYAFSAIRSYYPIADEVLLGLDADRLTWMQRPFALDERELLAFINAVDTGRKIRIVEGNFHHDPHPMVNESQERSALSVQAAAGNWVVQIDADEMLLNGPEFRQWLLAAQPTGYDVYARWLTVFKAFGERALVIDPPGEQVPVATMQRGEYIAGRFRGRQGVMSPLRLLHFSWGRSADEVRQKLENWGHARDLDTQAFFAMWQSVNLQNFPSFRDFHPLSGSTWHSLKLIEMSERAARSGANG